MPPTPPAQVRTLSTIWSALRPLCPLPVADCLFRTTEARNVDRVRRGGTDRFGLDRPEGCTGPPWTVDDWRENGYRGPFKPFVDVIYASTAEDVDASLLGQRSSALLKIPVTEDPHIIIYRRDAFVPVHDGQYAFRRPDRRRAAVLRIVAVSALAPKGD